MELGQRCVVIADLSYAHIAIDRDGIARLDRLPRMRVAQLIADHLAYGWDAEEICRQHPHLRPAEVHSAFAYYFDHLEAIEKEIENSDSREPSPLRLRLKKLRSA